MSHIKKETVTGFDAVHPVVLAEGLKVAAQLLALQGVSVTEHIFNWSGRKVTQFKGMQVVAGLGAEGATSLEWGWLWMSTVSWQLSVIFIMPNKNS